MGKELDNEYIKRVNEILAFDTEEKSLLSLAQQRLRIHEVPSKLYRYRPVSEHTIMELVSSHVYLARPDKFDDPYDSKYVENIEYNKIPILETPYQTLFNKLERERIREQNEYYNEHVGIASFSQTNTNNPMWYWYANKHRGVCFEYDLTNLGSFEELGYFLLPVIYPVKTKQEVFPIDGGTGNAVSALRNSIIKEKDWRFEQEWRIIKIFENHITNYDNSRLVALPVKAVYIGYEASADWVYLLAYVIRSSSLDVKLFMGFLINGRIEYKDIGNCFHKIVK